MFPSNQKCFSKSGAYQSYFLAFSYRVLPKIIGYFLIKRFKIQIQFGRISFPFSLRAIKIIKNGFSIVSRQTDNNKNISLNCQLIIPIHFDEQHIDEITIRSSFFNSEVTKLLSINIRDIRINKDIDQAMSQQQGDTPVRNLDDEDNLNVLDFRNKKVPHSIVTFAQVLASHFY